MVEVCAVVFTPSSGSCPIAFPFDVLLSTTGIYRESIDSIWIIQLSCVV